MGPIASLPAHLSRRLILPLAAAFAFGSAAGAQVVIASPPTAGSAQPVSPEPAVNPTAPMTLPSTPKCVVKLFQNATFNSAASQSFTYTPSCTGPWAKVVFTADFTIAAGTQTERNTEIFLGNATLFRGTTAIPSSSLSPSWHVEADVTDLSALLGAAQTVVAASLAPDQTYTSPVYANAELDFYPSDLQANLAPTVPDVVIPVLRTPSIPVQTFTAASPLTMKLTLPKNMTEIYLDVIAQPDEYWYLSTPNFQVSPYVPHSAPQTAFREVEVTIDGKPAGFAPNHPYVYAGGIDPYLWRPIPAAQALHLKPYRINLTPFAGALSDGAAHTIVISDIYTVGNAVVNGDLLIYTDHGGATTTGGVTTNTLAFTTGTTVTNTGGLDGTGNGNATVSESLTRSSKITGVVNSSAGSTTTTIDETMNFANSQTLTNTTSPVRNVIQENLTSTVDSTVTVASPTLGTTTTSHTENPLQASISYNQNADNTYTQNSTVTVSDVDNQVGPGTFTSSDSESVTAADSLQLDANQTVTGNTPASASSTGTYQSSDSLGNHYTDTLTSAMNLLSGAVPDAGSTGSDIYVGSSATTVAQGATVTLTATIVPLNSTLVPTGQVSFFSNGTLLSIVSPTKGVATVTVALNRAGANVITASYTGNNNFLPENSTNPLTITVTAVSGSFTVGPAVPATISVTPGASAVVSIPVTGSSTFTGTVALSCTGAPSGATCIVNPTSVALAPSPTGQGGSQTISVVVNTEATVAENHLPAFGNPAAGAFGGISVAGLFLLVLPKRRKGWKSMTLTVLMFCGLGLCSVGMLTGCGSGSTKAPAQTGTPAGTYTITVTGTSGAITNSTTFALTVN